MNMVDYAADDAWIAAELSGESVTYTPSGSTAVAKTLVVTPRESRYEPRNGWLVEIHRVNASASTDDYAPGPGDSFVHGGRTWDYAAMSQEESGGFVGAYFESMSLKFAGAVDSSPV
jgi:hypothetical protein